MEFFSWLIVVKKESTEFGAIQPFDRDPFQGAKISSDIGILLLGEIGERFGINSAFEEMFQHSRNL